MIVTLMDDRFNTNIRLANMSWYDFIRTNTSPEISYDKGKGAIIGGYCTWQIEEEYDCKKKTKRKKAKNRICINRQLIMLDADKPKNDFLERAKLYFGSKDIAWGYYTTFSAQEDNLRYRVCTFLDNPVNPENYQKITENIMCSIGQSEFDPVSANANQIMYLAVLPMTYNPKTGTDEGFFLKNFFGSKPIDSEAMLEEINNNSFPVADGIDLVSVLPKRTLLPTSTNTDGSVDPRTKDSIVGTFTSLYSVQDVMDLFLCDIYLQVGDRYKPIDSHSPPGGRIVENGLYYLTSHAKKDNAYGSLKNAYDLVLCNLEKIVAAEELKELKLKAIDKGILFPTTERLMYEWAMQIPEVREAEIERIKNKRRNEKYEL